VRSPSPGRLGLVVTASLDWMSRHLHLSSPAFPNPGWTDPEARRARPCGYLLPGLRRGRARDRSNRVKAFLPPAGPQQGGRASTEQPIPYAADPASRKQPQASRGDQLSHGRLAVSSGRQLSGRMSVADCSSLAPTDWVLRVCVQFLAGPVRAEQNCLVPAGSGQCEGPAGE